MAIEYIHSLIFLNSVWILFLKGSAKIQECLLSTSARNISWQTYWRRECLQACSLSTWQRPAWLEPNYPSMKSNVVQIRVADVANLTQTRSQLFRNHPPPTLSPNSCQPISFVQLTVLKWQRKKGPLQYPNK